jgi:hypothetical protein
LSQVLAIHNDAVPAQQRLPEASELEKVAVLFAKNSVGDTFQ